MPHYQYLNNQKNNTNILYNLAEKAMMVELYYTQNNIIIATHKLSILFYYIKPKAGLCFLLYSIAFMSSYSRKMIQTWNLQIDADKFIINDDDILFVMGVLLFYFIFLLKSGRFSMLPGTVFSWSDGLKLFTCSACSFLSYASSVLIIESLRQFLHTRMYMACMPNGVACARYSTYDDDQR